MARAAAVAAEINRGQATGPAGPLFRAGKKDSESLFDKDGKKIPAMDDDDPDHPKKDPKKEKSAGDEGFVELQSAGSAGDFTPMPGSLKDPFDSNADKGDSPAKNSTGDPETPTGI
jgi:hypothetical protein